MKIHSCYLNYTKWSKPVNGYGGQIQVRTCSICNSLDWRNVGYAQQVKDDKLSIAASEFNQHFV